MSNPLFQLFWRLHVGFHEKDHRRCHVDALLLLLPSKNHNWSTSTFRWNWWPQKIGWLNRCRYRWNLVGTRTGKSSSFFFLHSWLLVSKAFVFCWLMIDDLLRRVLRPLLSRVETSQSRRLKPFWSRRRMSPGRLVGTKSFLENKCQASPAVASLTSSSWRLEEKEEDVAQTQFLSNQLIGNSLLHFFMNR